MLPADDDVWADRQSAVCTAITTPYHCGWSNRRTTPAQILTFVLGESYAIRCGIEVVKMAQGHAAKDVISRNLSSKSTHSDDENFQHSSQQFSTI